MFIPVVDFLLRIINTDMDIILYKSLHIPCE